MSKPFQARLRGGVSNRAQHSLACEPLEQRMLLTTLPAGFTESTFSAVFARPTAMEFAPDGRMFVAEQGGSLRVFKNGSLLTTPFVTLSVDSSGERGLLGVTFDPNFATNNFVYVYYTTSAAPIHNRVSRFTANGDVAVAGSEVVLMDLDNLTTATNHNGGALHFGKDGKLYVAVGENATGSNSQTLTNRLGKMLRINSDGSIPNDNPFYNTATGANRSIWALGLRNPFTFGVQPGTGRMFINDVGQSTWEEIDDGIAGSNYGWPSQEGITGNPSFRDPLYAYPHAGGTAGGVAIVGGAFYNPPVNRFPADYAGDYFFGDLQNGWIRRYDPVSNTATLFASGATSGIVDFDIDSTGRLWYLTGAGGNSGRLRIIDYTGVVNSQLFYNNSSFDGGSSAGSADDAAIATNKLFLAPGATATFANYSSYSRGINGLVIDVVNVSHTPTLSDFEFRAGTTGAPTTWALAPATTSFTVRSGAGYGGSDRVTITWADEAIKNKWLAIRALTTLGMTTAQPFYFGNAVGESGNAAGSTVVNSTDEIGARQNPHSFLNPAAITDAYDFNRDGYVNATDQILARSNSTTAATSLPLITAPATLVGEIASAEELDVAVGLALAASTAGELAASSDLAAMPREQTQVSAMSSAAALRQSRDAHDLVAVRSDRLPRRSVTTSDELEWPIVDDSLCELLARPTS